MLWWILAAIAAYGLFAYEGRTAVGGGLTLGLIVGVLLALFWRGADWWIVGRAAVVGCLIGFAFELLPRLFAKLAR